MNPLSRPRFSVRFKHLGLALAGLALVAGCGHRRSALRPVYVGPSAVVAPEAPCATGDPTPAFGDPATLSSPPAGPSLPARPKSGDGSQQSGEEPGLIYPNNPSKGDTGEKPPPLSGPNARRDSSRRPALDTKAREQGVRERVSGFVKEPDDLFMPPKADRAWKYIVLHHSDSQTGSYAQIDRDHRDRLGTQGCGYHFVIGNGSESPDGKIEIASRWLNQKAGAHCRDAVTTEANDYGIGICIIGDLNATEPTIKQIEAAKALVSYLKEHYAIPADHIVAHSVIAQEATTCPGKLFPMAEVVNGQDFATR